MVNYNEMELMICLASRYLEDDSIVVVGTGASCAAAMLAQRTRAPKLMIMFEAGGVGSQLPAIPISAGDSRTFYKSLMAATMPEIMESCQRGMVDYTFLGGAQIDMYGNINSTIIGDYLRPEVRLPGSGGANDLASLCWRTMMITAQDKARFKKKIDFITTPGYLDGRRSREAAGLPADGGPYKIITDLAVLGFHDESRRMQVESLHPGITREKVVASTGFELLWTPDLFESVPPSVDELDILRNEVDSARLIIGSYNTENIIP